MRHFGVSRTWFVRTSGLSGDKVTTKRLGLNWIEGWRKLDTLPSSCQTALFACDVSAVFFFVKIWVRLTHQLHACRRHAWRMKLLLISPSLQLQQFQRGQILRVSISVWAQSVFHRGHGEHISRSAPLSGAASHSHRLLCQHNWQ